MGKILLLSVQAVHFDRHMNEVKMARHSKQSSSFIKSAGVLGVGALALSPMVAVANGVDGECEILLQDSFDAPGDVISVETLSGGICEVAVYSETPGYVPVEMLVPQGVTKLAALLVGRGDSSWSNISEGYGAGGGGQVTYVEFDQAQVPTNVALYTTQYETVLLTNPTTIENNLEFERVYFALPGAYLANYLPDGQDPWVYDQDLQSFVGYNPENNYGGSFGKMSNAYATYQEFLVQSELADGEPGALQPLYFEKVAPSNISLWNFSTDNSSYFSGHGTDGLGASGNGSSNLPGGGGITLSELPTKFSASPALWTATSQYSTFEFGLGGSALFGNDAVLPPLQPGMGASMLIGDGDIWPSSNSSDQYPTGGGNGIIILRFALPTLAGPAPAVYEGPTNLQFPDRGPAGSAVKLTGDNLSGLSKIFIGDTQVSYVLNSDGSASLRVPNLAPGLYDVRYEIGNKVTFFGKFRVLKGVSSQAAGPFAANQLFANFIGDNPSISQSNRNAVIRFLGSYSGVTHVTCVGLTSGTPALPSDQALAQKRAKNACDIVRTLLPNAEVKELTKTGAGSGSNYRGVRIYVRGQN